ncbi:MAG: hypothetical protein ACYC0X_22850 [Pirellulaceae bacterium]
MLPIRKYCFLIMGGLIACGGLCAEDWTDQRHVGRFQLRANFPLSQCEHLVGELQRLESDLTSALRIGTVEVPVHLLLFRDQATYEQYMKQYFEGAPVRRAMYIQGSEPGWVFAYRNSDFEVDLRHETTHALLHSQLPVVPLWLDEGLAEYYELAAEMRVYDNPYLSAVKRDAWLFRVPSLERLENLSDVRRMGKTEYRAAWSWVHFMLHGPDEAHQVLLKYLADIDAHQPPGSFRDRMYAALPDVETQYLRHFRSWHR